MIASRGLGGQIAVLGRKTAGELVEIMRESDVLVHLSRIDSYPLIVLEALACGMLPICMELAGARDMIESYSGYMVSQERPVEETVAVLLTLDLAEARSRARGAARRVPADDDWHRGAAALEGALEMCASGRGVGSAGGPRGVPAVRGSAEAVANRVGQHPDKREGE
jgi:glycosyltransferase involved in cell wall biosynthesis